MFSIKKLYYNLFNLCDIEDICIFNISSIKDSRWIQPSIELKDYDNRDDGSF